MDRRQFLAALGIGAAATAFIMNMDSCSKNSGIGAAPSNVNFTIDLSNSANSSLLTAGGYIYQDNIIIIKTVKGNYIALSMICTHAGCTVQYDGLGDQIFCPCHGSTYSDNGQVTGGPAPSSLQTYKTSLSGNSLRIYS